MSDRFEQAVRQDEEITRLRAEIEQLREQLEAKDIFHEGHEAQMQELREPLGPIKRVELVPDGLILHGEHELVALITNVGDRYALMERLAPNCNEGG